MSLQLHVDATALTNPADARRLASGFTVLRDHDRTNGHHTDAAFIGALIEALHHYAKELEHAHDQVVREVSDHWFRDEEE